MTETSMIEENVSSAATQEEVMALSHLNQLGRPIVYQVAQGGCIEQWTCGVSLKLADWAKWLEKARRDLIGKGAQVYGQSYAAENKFSFTWRGEMNFRQFRGRVKYRLNSVTIAGERLD